ncbi:MAG: NAD-dependent epimerase/dehydratase family protein [Candidatus Aminicenantes bacterium]|nr:NAD-dependent epimerase/dehydratase family protein [Candidatus Aminicenantes bacterium]
MNKKTLITGIAGFIGSNLAKRLLKERHEVFGIDNLSYGLKENIPNNANFFKIDIRNKKIYPLFKGIDTVFHLAAKNCINDCQLNPVETADINVTGTVNVFEAAKRAKVRKLVYAESSALYEGSNIFPTPESEVKPESFYSISKLSSMYFAKAYQTFFDLQLTALRYFCVYGPVQDYRRTIPPVMSAFIIKLLKGERPIIYGTGKKRRDFVYVDDVNDFHIKCINNSRTDNKIFNLGSGVNYSVLEIYKLVSELLGKRIEPIFKPALPGEAEITLADITEAKKLGWKPKTDIKTGLLKAIEYIKSEMAAGRA